MDTWDAAIVAALGRERQRELLEQATKDRLAASLGERCGARVALAGALAALAARLDPDPEIPAPRRRGTIPA